MQRAIAIALAATVGLASGCKGKKKESAPAAGSGSAVAGTGSAKPRPHPPKQRPATEEDLFLEQKRKLLLERGDPKLMEAKPAYVTTAPNARPQDLVKPIDKDHLAVGAIKVNITTGRAEIPAKIASPSGPLEYVAVAENGKTHETLLTVTITAIELRLALSLIGYEGTIPEGNDRIVPPPTAQDSVLVSLIVNGKEKPVSAYLWDRKNKKPPKDHDWQVVGFRPEDRDQALLTKDFFTLAGRDPFGALHINTDTGNPYAGPNVGYTFNAKALPKAGEEVTLVIKRRPEKAIITMPSPTNMNPIPVIPPAPTP